MQITGTQFADYLYGTSGADRIDGLGGGDEIYAGAGDDLVLGGDGNDRIQSQGGSDRLEGEAGNDWLWIYQSTQPGEHIVALGGSGNDEISFALYGTGGGFIEIDGGEGNDIVRVSALISSTAVLTLGQGRDVIRFDAGYSSPGQGSIAVVDFDGSASGDWIDWDEYLRYKLTGWDSGTNPFASGHMRLVQDGSDTLLQIDPDGAAGIADALTLLTFRNVATGSLTAESLGGYDPAGGPTVGQTFMGTADRDVMRGSAGGDLIEGLDGNDQIFGLLGDDTLRGGDGDDDLRGDSGNDRLEGGAGADYLQGGLGDDRSFGGDGDDVINNDGGGFDEMYGEGGNDRIRFYHSTSNATNGGLVSGGAGDDQIEVFFAAEDGTVTVDAGSGADIVTLVSVYYSEASITLGADRDILRLDQNMSTSGSAVIEDFTAGADGDELDWLAYLGTALTGWDGAANPFSTGYVRLVQSGADTLLQVDRDGLIAWWDTGNFETLLTFRNTQASSLTAENLGGYESDGTAPVPMTLTGTEGNDALAGSTGSDTIEGGGGDDVLTGGAGHDTLRGGDANDTLNGDLGNDVLEGDDGADVLDGGAGGDRIHGGEGDDQLTSRRGASEELHGDGGNDTLIVSHYGGEYESRNDVILATGGTGDDTFWVTSYNNSSITVDGGAGADIVNVQALFLASVTITFGDGRDELWLAPYYNLNTGTAVVTDFAAGPDGDFINWDDYLESWLIDWEPAANPFAAGYAALVQDGANTLVQMDRDASGTRFGFTTVMTLRNTAPADFDASNFQGFDPQVPVVSTGTDGADVFTGRVGRDAIDGGAGNDQFLLEQGGDDSASGSAGEDLFYYGAAYTSADSNNGGAGTQDVVVLQGDYSVTMGASSLVDVEYLVLYSGTTTRFGDVADNRYDYDVTMVDANVGAGKELRVNGLLLTADESFAFDGSAESDGYFLVYGGSGADDLTGGAGGDGFYFEGTRFGSGDRVDGGLGSDVLILRGVAGVNTTVFGADQLASIEFIVVSDRFATSPSQLPSYALVLANGNVPESGTLTVNGFALVNPAQTFDVDGSAITTGNLRLFGGGGDDVLTGGAGNDLFYGVGGRDTLTGGGGSDTFQLRSLSDSTVAAADAILDFTSGTDKVDLSMLDANANSAGNQAFSFIGGGAFSGLAGELRAYDSGSGLWRVEGDVDGDGLADFALDVHLATPEPLVSADFIA